MVGDHTPATEDCSLCSLLWAPFPSSGVNMLRMLGDPSPSKGGEDFFQKSLGDPFPTSGGYIYFVNGRWPLDYSLPWTPYQWRIHASHGRWPIPQQRRIVRHAHCCGPHSLLVVDTFSSKMVGDPFPSKGGVDFFQKSLGDPWTIVGLELKKDYKLSRFRKM